MKGVRNNQLHLKRKAMVNVYLEPYEKEILIKKCEDSGITMSTFFRTVLREKLNITVEDAPSTSETSDKVSKRVWKIIADATKEVERRSK